MNIIRGTDSNPHLSDELIKALSSLSLNGTLYLGFPIISIDDETNHCDVMFLSEKYGIIVFDFNNRNFSNYEEIETTHDKLYLALKSKLTQHMELTKKEGRERVLDIPIEIILFSHNIPNNFKEDSSIICANPNNLKEAIFLLSDKLDPKYIQPLKAAIDSVKTIKPRKKRAGVSKIDSKGGKLKIIEREIANLDKWQLEAAIETPEGPQRIRGLAGSGKTVVLARKAAYLHGQHPDWNIVVTYNTRSLHQQIKELIRRFYYDQCLDEPNWDKIRIIHAWGGRAEGIYSQIAEYYNIKPKTFLEAKSKYGYNNALRGVCNELLEELNNIQEKKEPLYDALLIDEAQDLPMSFFRIAYEVVKKQKRIIWAYDELQNLGGYSMRSPEDLFGKENGIPRVSLKNKQKEPKQDIILPVCYRNTKWALTVAHALGFGVYREKGLVQIFNDADLWDDIGYELEGDFDKPNECVKLKRKEECSPSFFNKHLTPEDSIKCQLFEDSDSQYDWMIKDIKKNLEEQEIEEDDILIILTDPLTGRKEAPVIMQKLLDQGLNAHIVGITNDKETVFIKKSIAISGIHRAKGNEAPLVYIVNSQYCFDGIELSRKRNILFTAITRSRAWVRILGFNEYNNDMNQLLKEFNKIVEKNYCLEFLVPTDEELDKLRQIHRDRTQDSKERIEKAKKYKKFIESLPEDERKLIEEGDFL